MQITAESVEMAHSMRIASRIWQSEEQHEITKIFGYLGHRWNLRKKRAMIDLCSQFESQPASSPKLES
jgi:predicted hydrocarbon binding protein